MQNKHYLAGLLAGLGASVCQAAGLILARQGLEEGFSPLSANFIRMLVAAATIWLFTLFQGQAKQTLHTLRQYPAAGRYIFLGAFMGPFLGVSLSLFALQHVKVGVASTLSSLPPVFLLPVSYVIFKERFGWQAIAGTFLAIAGSAVLFLV
jgi:drug/metabolite transporter (DMT)-like permease